MPHMSIQRVDLRGLERPSGSKCVAPTIGLRQSGHVMMETSPLDASRGEMHDRKSISSFVEEIVRPNHL